jgi:hypothetical protein
MALKWMIGTLASSTYRVTQSVDLPKSGGSKGNREDPDARFVSLPRFERPVGSGREGVCQIVMLWQTA